MPLKEQTMNASECTGSSGTLCNTPVHRSPGEKLKPEICKGDAKDCFGTNAYSWLASSLLARKETHTYSQIKGKKALTYLKAEEGDWCHSWKNNGCCCRKAFHNVICVLNNNRGVEATYTGKNWKADKQVSISKGAVGYSPNDAFYSSGILLV